MNIDEFLTRLGSADPVPGGGSVAALEVAMGGALLCMVCELTLAQPRFAAVEQEIAGVRDAATALGTRSRELVDLDSEAYGRVAAAMRLPRSTQTEKEVRRAAVQAALKEAVAPPLETMALGRRGLDLALTLAPIGNPSAVSDVGSGALALAAGAGAAQLNVEINLSAIRDQAFVAATRGTAPALEEIERVSFEVLRLVRETIGRAG